MVTRWGAGRWWTAGGHLDTGQGQMAQDGCLTIMGSSLTFHNWYICLCPDQQINCKTYCDIAIIWGDYNSVKSGYLMRQLQWIRQNQDDTKIQSNLKLFWYLQIHQILISFINAVEDYQIWYQSLAIWHQIQMFVIIHPVSPQITVSWVLFFHLAQDHTQNIWSIPTNKYIQT